MGFSLTGAIKSAASYVGDKVGDAEDAIDDAKGWVGGKIDDAVEGAEHGLDSARKDIRDFGEHHGGIVGKALGNLVSDSIGVTEGAGLAVYDMGKGVVQLADGAGKLLNPVEWATHGSENLQRLEHTGLALKTLSDLGNPVAWATNPGGNIDTAKALWNGVTGGYQDAAKQGDWSKFVGRGVVDIGSLLIGAGEANAAIKGTEGASAVAKIGEVGEAAEGAGVVGKAGDATRGLDGAASAGKAGEAGKAVEAAADLSRGEAAAKAGDLSLAGKGVDAQRAALTALVNDGRIAEARNLLKPLLEAGDREGLIARLDVSTPAGKTYFWSGDAKTAEGIATKSGGATLEATPGGKILDGWKDIPKWNDGGKEIWGGASEKFAQGASGDVTVVLTRGKAISRGGDTWRNVESGVVKQLRQEGIVTDIKVIVIDPLNPAKLVPLTGLAAEDALRSAGLPC